MADDDVCVLEKIDRNEEISLKEEMNKKFGPPRKSLEIFEESMMMDGEDMFLLRSNKPNREEMFEHFSALERLEMPPRGKL